GSFSQDARGRWYFNIVVHVDVEERLSGHGQIGIDLGLKTTATCSSGDSVESQDCYRNSEDKLGKAERANKKKQVKCIDAKI
ncbi:MAG: transposase, partial [Methylobacter sp.]|nr:transposase [Methylobacter sp.]